MQLIALVIAVHVGFICPPDWTQEKWHGTIKRSGHDPVEAKEIADRIQRSYTRFLYESKRARDLEAAGQLAAARSEWQRLSKDYAPITFDAEANVALKQGDWQGALELLSKYPSKPEGQVGPEDPRFSLRKMYAAARLGDVSGFDEEACRAQVRRCFAEEDWAQTWPTVRTPQSCAFMSAIAYSSMCDLQTLGWWARRAEDVYPDNPLSCHFVLKLLSKDRHLLAMKDVATRGIAMARGKLKDDFRIELREIDMHLRDERFRNGGG